MVTIRLATRKKMSTQLCLGMRSQYFACVLYKNIYIWFWIALGMKMVKVALYVFKARKRLGTENTIKPILSMNVIILCKNL